MNHCLVRFKRFALIVTKSTLFSSVSAFWPHDCFVTVPNKSSSFYLSFCTVARGGWPVAKELFLLEVPFLVLYTGRSSRIASSGPSGIKIIR